MAEQRQVAVNRMGAPAGSPRRPGPAAFPLTSKEAVAILRRRVWWIVAGTMLGLIIGGASWFLLLQFWPRYTAQTFIKVLPPVEKDPISIVAALVNKDLQFQHRSSMASLIRQQSMLLRLLDRDKIRETKWFKRFAKFDAQGNIINNTDCITEALKDLEKYLVASALRDAEFVSISMTCGDAQEAADIVNEMVELFLREQGTITEAEIASRLRELEERRKAVQGEVDGTDKQMDRLRETRGITDLELPASGYYQHTYAIRLTDLELEQNDLMLAMSQTKATIENLERMVREDIGVQIEHAIETDPIMLVLAQQRDLQKSVLAGRLARFGENHRSVQQIQELISEIEKKRQDRKLVIAEQTRQANLRNAQDVLLVLEGRSEELTKLRQEAEAKKKDLDLARVEYQRLVVIRDERQEMLDTIKAQIEKLRIMREDPETAKLRRVGPAPEPREVSSPRWEFYFPGGTILGLLAALGLVFLIELVNDLVRTPRDVARYLRIPLLAAIPDASDDEQVKGVDLCHVVRQAPYSIISESYRRLRTNLKLSGSAEPLRTVLVCSGMAGDGTTSVAVNLATTFVAENKRVLLVDANFRRPSLHTIFPRAENAGGSAEPSGFGLSSVLVGQSGYRDAIRSSGIEGLDVIDSGPLPPNPVELLGGASMQQFIEKQRASYDYVVLDAPPVLLVTDAKVLAKFTDGTVLVFNAAATRRGAAQRAIRELDDVSAKVSGCVLFAVKAMKGGYFEEQLASYQKYQKLQLLRSV